MEDIKVIFGLDYMGKWANIHITIGMEPTPIEESESFTMPEWIWYLFMASGGALLLGFFTGQHAIHIRRLHAPTAHQQLAGLANGVGFVNGRGP